MMKFRILPVLFCFLCACSPQKKEERQVIDFDGNWQFTLADSIADYSAEEVNVSDWRTLNLPHDWSIEADFSKDNPATPGGGALPGGIGWYRKTFTLPVQTSDLGAKQVYIDFDGIYRNSEVWFNGRLLGKRPYGYISFRYDLTPSIRWGEENVIAVKVDNSQQPNSRWYSGSGIYRNVHLVVVNAVHIDQWGTYVTTPAVSEKEATIRIQTTVKNQSNQNLPVQIRHTLKNAEGKTVLQTASADTDRTFTLANPVLWSIENPYLYKIITTLEVDGKIIDDYETTLGIRSFEFDADKGFILNGKPVKIKGVCEHHDLGCLGAAVNERALERQLQILKDMGCNGIRTSHNPPAPELLDLCDKMGFIVMDEAFDMWEIAKSPSDYSHDFPEWHERDLTDLILRDRNHPSVFVWSIGNEVMEQWEGNGVALTQELTAIVKKLDATRPVIAACNGDSPTNPLFRAEVLDIIGFNYNEKSWPDSVFFKNFPHQKFIVTESTSGLMSRGYYEMPANSIYIRAYDWNGFTGLPVQQNSAYDNVHVPWGSTHEVSWRLVKQYDHIAGMYIWTGFDYLGEPTPFGWPSRSSYFGIIDLAGFPKDVYYMYQSEWTDQDVLHVFPHWNWQEGQAVDVWAYYNNADEVELYLNDKSLGKKAKQGDELHVWWRVPFEKGTLKAVSRKNGKEVLTKEIRTAGAPASIRLTADRKSIKSDGKDLAFVTVEVVDANGIPVPTADNFIEFTVTGNGSIVGTDNGDSTDPVSLKKPQRKLFNGKALVVVQSIAATDSKPIILKAQSKDLPDAQEELKTKN
jgi:beta-galactosidase